MYLHNDFLWAVIVMHISIRLGHSLNRGCLAISFLRHFFLFQPDLGPVRPCPMTASNADTGCFCLVYKWARNDWHDCSYFDIDFSSDSAILCFRYGHPLHLFMPPTHLSKVTYSIVTDTHFHLCVSVCVCVCVCVSERDGKRKRERERE